jgi:hypothetical protein
MTADLPMLYEAQDGTRIDTVIVRMRLRTSDSFRERTVQDMAADSKRRGKPQVIVDSDDDRHRVEFRAGEASAVICPKLGRCKITGWD